MSGAPGRSRTVGRVATAVVVDIALVIAFAAVGRASHESDVLTGLAQTAWPFVAGLLAGWLLSRGWRAPVAPVRTGIAVWASALLGGMLLRAASGQGTALAFIIVASLTLFALLVGWRALARVIQSVRARRREVVA